jgi:tetratricopeptide (TPR) repeat protein
MGVHAKPQIGACILPLVLSVAFHRSAALASQTGSPNAQTLATWTQKGIDDLQLDDSRNAHREFLASAQTKPRSGKARFYPAISELGPGGYSAAEKDFHCSLELNPRSKRALYNLRFWAAPFAVVQQPSNEAMTHFQRARQLMSAGDLEHAAGEYEAGLRGAPDSPGAYNNLGVIYFKMGNLNGARLSFERAYALEPKDPEIAFNYGLALYQCDRCPQALQPLTESLPSRVHVADARYLLGVCYCGAHNWRSAIDNLEAARKLAADRPEVLFLLTQAYRNSRLPKQSLEISAELLQKFPGSPFAHFLLGEALDEGSLPQQSEVEFKQAILASPNAPQLHFALGYLYWRWKEYQKAVEPFQMELRIDPKCATCYFYLGDIELRKHQAHQGVNHFTEALKLLPDYSDAYLGLGRAYVMLGQPRKAVAAFQQALRLQPGRSDAHYWLGKTLIQTGDVAQGQKELDTFQQSQAAELQQAADLLQHVEGKKIKSVAAAPDSGAK